MDLKDFGKQLDGLTSDNSFDNAIFLPNDVANILPKCVYWNKEVEALWVQNPQEEDNVKRFCTSFFVTIKTNEKGLFINGNLAVKWDNKRIVKENAVMYQSHGAALALMETGIICKFDDDEIDSMIMFNVDENVKKFVEENQSKYISLNLCNFSYWKKEEICVVQKTKNRTTKYKGKIMADETGLYLDGELRYSWDDYFPLVRKKNEKEQLSLLKKTELDNWGDSKYGFYPQKNYFVMSDNAIIDKEETILVGFAAKIGTNYNSLAEKKDLPVLKEQYYTLKKQDSSVFSPHVTIDCAEFSANTFKLFIDFKWIIDTNLIILNFLDFYERCENNQMISVSNQRFKNGTFTIVLDKQIDYTLKLASTNFEDNDNYFYYLSKKIVREIGFAKRLDIKLKGDGCDYSIKANELIDLAKTFDKELFDSPKHEMDYYKADFLFEKNQYVDANRYILAAVKEVADNAQYNELAEKIKTKLLNIETDTFHQVQTLYSEKKYEESVKLLDSIYIVARKEEIESLRKQIVDDWVVDLANKGDSQFKNSNTILAVSNYKKALKLHPEDTELKTKLQKAEASLKAKAKNTAKKIAISVIAFIVIIVIGSFVSDKISEYQYEQEWKEQMEENKRYEAEVEKIKEDARRDIEICLNEVCKELTTHNLGTERFLTKEFMMLLDKAYNIGGPDFMDANVWLNSQEWETITYTIQSFESTDLKAVVGVYFVDSWSGQRPLKIIDFVRDNGEWKVDDLKNEDGWSLKKYSKDFIRRNN